MKIRKTQYIIFALVIFLYFAPAKIVSAHFLATDQNIGAVLHVDPNDEPVAGQVANFYFEFKDKTGKFNGHDCDCTFLIQENGKQLYSVPLTYGNAQKSIWNASAAYTFPAKGVYHVEVTGKPTQNNAFQPFNLQWDFRVDQDATAQSTTPSFTNQLISHLFQVALLAIVVIILVLIIVKAKKKSKTHNEK